MDLFFPVFQQQRDCTATDGSGDDTTTTGSGDDTTTTGIQCPPNSHYGTVSGCDITCSRLANPRGPCAFYIGKGCQCDAGLYRQAGTSGNSVDCVRPEDCIVTCPENMYYEPYASGCQPTCEAPEVPKLCNKECSPQCVCDEGYILDDKTHACVKQSDCP
ncbi:alpha-tectorin-like [Pseudophryne corroboree]|uniref:alpha-tectorin-like n=1 Tax=Pseudophryne corroboree TaxID=495146 RepID=UPI003081E263